MFLKHHVAWIQIVMPDYEHLCFPKVFQNKFMDILIHHTFIFISNSRFKSSNTIPNHNMSTTMFDYLLDML